jgi:hypothetical protein
MVDDCALTCVLVFSNLTIGIEGYYEYTIAAAACGLTIRWMQLKIFHRINSLDV